MSSRPDKNSQFETGLPELSTPECGDPSSGADSATMQALQFASESVLRLATQTHAAVARSDPAAAEAARVALEAQLSHTTQLIDELLFGRTDPPTTH
jgi:hypothetical protein